MTFLLVTFGWLLFRSATFSDAIEYFRSLWSLPRYEDFFIDPLSLFVVGLGLLFVLFEPRIPRLPERFSTGLAVGFVILFLVCLITIYGNTASPFIYFQF